MFAFGPVKRVWPAKRVNVWPAKLNISAFYQQDNISPAKRLPTSKRTYHQQTDVPPANAFPKRP